MMGVKTVWHWGNLAKVLLVMVPVVAGTTAIIGYLGLDSTPAGTLLGVVAGAGGALLALDRRPGWHFE